MPAATTSPAEMLAEAKKAGPSPAQPKPVKFACRLAEYRKRLGLSQRGLAKACRVTNATIYLWERGCHSPSLHAACRLARFFGCAVQDLWPDADAEQTAEGE